MSRDKSGNSTRRKILASIGGTGLVSGSGLAAARRFGRSKGKPKTPSASKVSGREERSLVEKVGQSEEYHLFKDELDTGNWPNINSADVVEINRPGEDPYYVVTYWLNETGPVESELSFVIQNDEIIESKSITVYYDGDEPDSVEAVIYDDGEFVEESAEIGDLQSETPTQSGWGWNPPTKCDICPDVYTAACAIGCGLSMAAICVAAGLAGGVTGVLCTTVAITICHFISKYGCVPAEESVCEWAGYC